MFRKVVSRKSERKKVFLLVSLLGVDHREVLQAGAKALGGLDTPFLTVDHLRHGFSS